MISGTVRVKVQENSSPKAITHMIDLEQFPVDLVTFTEEILNGKLHFLCSDYKTMKTFFHLRSI